MLWSRFEHEAEPPFLTYTLSGKPSDKAFKLLFLFNLNDI